MRFRFTGQEEAFRKEVEDFLSKELPPGWVEGSLQWPGGYGSHEVDEEHWRVNQQLQRRIAERGWASISWPREYGGREYSPIEHAIFEERTSYYRVPPPGFGATVAGPTILLFGSEDMKQEWLPRIATAEVEFWFAYSEPGAGSDLASLQTRAVDDGDEFVINGQKTWGSGAHLIDYAWVAVRTDPDAGRHGGISLLIVDMKTPGITVRPLMNMCGVHSFNEIFFDDARVPKKNLIGEKDRGWYYLVAALDFERLMVGVGGFKRVFEMFLAYVKETRPDGGDLARSCIVRNLMAEVALRIEVAYMFYWQTAWMLSKGLLPNMEASVLKLWVTELSRHFAEAAMQVLGLYGLLETGSKWSPFNGLVPRGYLDCVSATIGAGTSEIQRNIIAMRGLGLPRK
jgi:alkylation response protein AidB-like acyl-CoA dehydrogenase